MQVNLSKRFLIFQRGSVLEPCDGYCTGKGFCSTDPFDPQVARRSWSGSDKARETICRAMRDNDRLRVTLPHRVKDAGLVQRALRE